ncbi:MAG TPA: NAD(P)-dependent oxidoreductase [Roseiarcus sp.]|jgi:nucleoside-diphosphate-sugar epimerase|nr:NAD(P)-dependent oxidoreductase [Roseiarcus sp.]
MTVLVTGSSGHLGEALMRTLRASGRAALGLDIIPGLFTDAIGSIADRALVARSLQGIDAVLHVATLHKPHVATHAPEAFLETNVRGTLVLLEEAVRARVRAFVMTSTTSTFGDALKPPEGQPAAWIDERIAPVPKNIYGVTKTAAEDLCQLFHRNEGLASVVLRTSRFFPEEDDDPATRESYADDNTKTNEYLFRRVAIEDVVDAHLLAIERAATIGFGRYIISATTPFLPADCAALRVDAPATLSLRAPGWEDEYSRRGWRMFPSIDRVYDNVLARQDLGWRPKWDFIAIVERLRATGDIRGPLARQIGVKGYHAERFEGAPYPVTGAPG